MTLYYEYNRRLKILVLLFDIEIDKRSKNNLLPERKNRDMTTTMNRIYCLNNESYESSLLKRSEWGLYFMHSFKDRQLRENVVDRQTQ